MLRGIAPLGVAKRSGSQEPTNLDRSIKNVVGFRVWGKVFKGVGFSNISRKVGGHRLAMFPLSDCTPLPTQKKYILPIRFFLLGRVFSRGVYCHWEGKRLRT